MPVNVAKLRPSHVRKVFRARLKWARKAAPRAIGLSIERVPPSGTLEHEVRYLIRRLSIDLVVDVGAHKGEYGRSLRRLGYRGRIASFEPSRESFAVVASRAANDPLWDVTNCALGDADGSLMLTNYRDSVFNSLLGGVAMNLTNFDVVGHEQVEVVTLDSRWSTVARPSDSVLLKIDTQGFDLKVLRGASKALNDCQAVQIEVSGKALYQGSPPLHEVLGYLHEIGFRLTGMFPIVRDPTDGVTVIDFDATLVRENNSGRQSTETVSAERSIPERVNTGQE